MAKNAKVGKVKVTDQGHPYRSLKFHTALIKLVISMLKKFDNNVIVRFC